MATTFLSVVNDILSEMNEVLLTSANFDSATNIQRSVKEFVNRAYMDLNAPKFKWPWLSINATSPTNDFYYGNAYIETVAGTRWYKFNSSSTNYNDDYGHIDWETIRLTTQGVSGETIPYTVRDLKYTEIEEWQDNYATKEDIGYGQSTTYSTPRRIMRNPDNRRFGLSPIPDKVYRIYFYGWTRPVALTNYDETFVLPDQYIPVLKSRARYYAWQRKENAEQAAIALQEYENGVKDMEQQEIKPAPDKFTDDRIRT